MDFSSVPVIVVICYIIGEIYKVVFKENTNAYKIIPILVAFVGGILGVIVFHTSPEVIFDVDNVWDALLIGILSGFSATGTNQIFKQLFIFDDKKVGGDCDDRNN